MKRAAGMPELIGRQRELRVLTEAVDGVRDSGRAIVVLGAPGIGKSSLVAAAAGHARRAGLRVLSTTAVEAEAQLPYAGLHQLLRPVLAAASALPPAQGQALEAAFGAGDDDAPPQPFMIALAALNLLADVAAERPVLLAVDDVQWLDIPSRDVIAFVARRLEHDPIVLIAAIRAGGAIPFTMAGLPELDVPGLDDEAARELLTTRSGDLSAAERERILAEAAGNPLALVELPAALRAAAAGGLDADPAFLPLTARLERAFASRITGLPPLTSDAVLVAAADESAELPEILAATSVLAGQPAGVTVLEPAAAAGLILFDDLHVRFRHPLVRSAILQRESASRRQAANAALATVLVGDPYRHAWHRALSITGLDDDVADELEASHHISLRRGSVPAAIRALERSAQLTTSSAERGRRLLLAAEHAFGLGRADLVDQLLSRADRTSLSPLQQARMEWLREIFSDGVPGDTARVMQLCEIAARAIEADDEDLALNLLLGAGLRCWWADTGPRARARVAEVIARSPGTDTDPRHVAALAVAEPVLRGAVVDGLLSRTVIENVIEADALRLLGMAAHAIGDPVRAADFLDRSESKLRAQGRLGLLPHVLGMQSPVCLELGDWDRAEEAAPECRQFAAETGQPIWTSAQIVNEARAAALRGDSDRALELVAQGEHMPVLRDLNDLRCCLQLARGFALITSGRHDQATDALLRVFDPATPAFHQRERFSGVMFLAEAAAHAGREDEARSVIAELGRVTAVTPAPLLHVQMSYARAVLAGDAGAEELYLAALGQPLSRWPWVRARIELAFGRWLRRQRRVAESRQPLRSAQITLDLIGARYWAEQARAELRAAGERTAFAADPGPGGEVALSAQELQIARLAADGLSNREIGERLFLSPRTVGSHLYRIFPKLDITSRAQLAARLDPS